MLKIFKTSLLPNWETNNEAKKVLQCLIAQLLLSVALTWKLVEFINSCLRWGGVSQDVEIPAEYIPPYSVELRTTSTANKEVYSKQTPILRNNN